jgi:adenylate cyclase
MQKKVLYIVFAVSTLLVFLFFPGTSAVDDFIFDFKSNLFCSFRYKDNQQNQNIVLIEIDKDTLKGFDETVGYQENARLLNLMKPAGVKCVIFALPASGNTSTNIGKTAFDREVTRVPVFLVSYLEEGMLSSFTGKVNTPDAKLLNLASGTGLIYLSDNRTVTRQKPLVRSMGNKKIPSIELITAAFLEKVASSGILYRKNGVFIGVKKIPVDDNNNTYLLPFKKDFFPRYSYIDLFNNMPDLKGKIAIIGWAAEDDKYINIPRLFSRRESYPFSIASTLYAITSGIMVAKLPVWLEILFSVFLVAVAGFFIPLYKTEKLPKITIIAALAFLLFNVTVFMFGLNMPAGAVTLTLLFFGLFLWQYRYHKTKSLASRFVHMKLVKLLQHGDPEAEMQTVVRRAAVLFSDIKGYTTFAERYSPAQVMEILKEYVTMMNDVVEANDGVVLNYQGDSLMALFGLTNETIDEKEAAFRGVKTALEMQESIEQLRRKWQLEGRELFVVGIGVCVGDIAIGVLGSEAFRQYTAVGDAVNEAARLQALAKEMRASIFIGDNAQLLIRDKFRCTKVQQTFLKGKFQVSGVYQVDGYADDVQNTNRSDKI